MMESAIAAVTSFKGSGVRDRMRVSIKWINFGMSGCSTRRIVLVSKGQMHVSRSDGECSVDRLGRGGEYSGEGKKGGERGMKIENITVET